jgi:integrase
MSRFKQFNLAQAMSESAAPEPLELTFDELCSAFEAAHPCDTLTRLRKWRAAFGPRSAWSINTEELRHARDAMVASGYSPGSANRDLSQLGTVYIWAIERRKCAPAGFRSPTVDVSRLGETMRVVTFTPAECARLRAASMTFKDRRFSLFVHLMLDTGARPGELLERTWDRFDTVNREVVLRADEVKTARARVLHFTEATARLIERLRPAPSMRHQLVFVGRKGAPTDYRKSWRALFEMIGRSDLRAYDMRHVAAAALLAADVPLGKAAQVLGHSSLILHKRYGHLDHATLKTAQQQAWHHRDAMLGDQVTRQHASANAQPASREN